VSTDGRRRVPAVAVQGSHQSVSPTLELLIQVCDETESEAVTHINRDNRLV